MRIILSLIIALQCLSVIGQDVQYTDTIGRTIEHYLKRQNSNGNFNGNILIAKGDSIVYTKSFGLVNRELAIEHTDSSKFLIGSITKPFTAMAILILAEQNKLGLDDRLYKYFPKFQSAASITISQLLHHTSGIADYKLLTDWQEDSKSDNTTPYTTISKMSNQPLLFSPGESFKYSNVGYILLGLVIEKVSNMPFDSFIQKNILNPLDLKHTGIIKNESVISLLASGYSSTPRETNKSEYINYQQPFSSGNMYSTTYDLWLFTKAVTQSKLLPLDKTNQLFTNGKYYSNGWGIRDYDGTKAYGHYGGMNGFVGAITYLPVDDYFICILTNDDNTPKVRITQDLVAIIQGERIELPPRKSLISISNLIKKQIIGTYQIKPGNELTIFEEGNKLYQQENGQMKHELFPFENYSFSFQLLEFYAQFSKIENGLAQELKLISTKTILTAKRI